MTSRSMPSDNIVCKILIRSVMTKMEAKFWKDQGSWGSIQDFGKSRDLYDITSILVRSVISKSCKIFHGSVFSIIMQDLAKISNIHTRPG